MERLTFVDEDGRVLFDNPAGFPEDVGFTIRELSENEEWETLDNIAQRLANCEQRLKYYKDLEEQGKLLQLPCAVGDILYSVSFRKKCYKMGNTYFVNDDLQCAFCESESVCNSKIEYFIEEINATLPIIANLIDRPDGFMIFLTKSAAEQALKEMEGKK